MFHRRAETPIMLDGLDAARTFFAPHFDGLAVEQLWVAHVDKACRCVHLARYPGSAGAAAMPLRDILLDAARHGSAGLVLAHNHPSGDASHSDSDRRATRRLAVVADAIDLPILDHLVFAGAECRSFRRLGLL